MTYEEMEKSLQELRDTQLVHVHLLDRHEREWNERFSLLTGVVGSHEDGIAEMRARFARLTEVVESHEDGIAELRAAMAKLFDRMDRFIQGLERENGHQ